MKERSNQKELLDDSSLSGELLHRNLKELAIVNRWLGGYAVLRNALKNILKKSKDLSKRSHFTLADLGCGGGDMLRTVANWSRCADYEMQLQGFDINSSAIDYARDNSYTYSQIIYQELDVFSENFRQKRFDIVMMNLFCHHLTNDQFVYLLNQLKGQTRIAIVINDLHRHWLAYFGIKWLTRLLPCSRLVQHDGPLSVRRSFRKPELEKLLAQAGFQSFSIRWFWAFRWQVIIWV